jgi:cation diffusion facilitator family transporter
MPTLSTSIEHHLDRQTKVRRILMGILAANIAVVIVKLLVGYTTQSLAVFGDAIHSSADAVNNLLGLAVVRVAAKAPDAEHPYGHAKFETLGALVIVMMLSVSIFELARSAVGRLASNAVPPTVPPTALALLVLTLAVNVLVVWVETRAARRLDSDILMADALHTRVDVLITLAVLGGLALVQFGWAWADPVLALVVAALVGHAGYAIVQRAIPALVDERVLDPASIRHEAEQVEGVRAAYAIRSRGSVTKRFAELTIAVDGRADVASAHEIADRVEERLRGTLQLHEVLVHVEPC